MYQLLHILDHSPNCDKAKIYCLGNHFEPAEAMITQLHWGKTFKTMKTELNRYQLYKKKKKKKKKKNWKKKLSLILFSYLSSHFSFALVTVVKTRTKEVGKTKAITHCGFIVPTLQDWPNFNIFQVFQVYCHFSRFYRSDVNPLVSM